MRRLFSIVLTWSLAVSVSASEELSLKERLSGSYELGVGVGGQVLNDYRGSKDSQVQVLPFPYLAYQGDFIKIDRSGARGEFFANNRFEFNISAELALNGDSDDNELRDGMPELKTAAQAGPSFNINLSGPDFQKGFALRMPARAIFAVDLDKIEPIGYMFAPKLTYRQPGVLGPWDFKYDIGVTWASSEYHDYYYAVDPQYVTATRPGYQTGSGFSGVFGKAGLKARFGDWLVGGSVRYDNLSGAVFEDSPLVETDHYWSFSFGVVWLFHAGEVRF